MEEQQELIEKYIGGLLPEAERREFEKKLQEDSSFRAEVLPLLQTITAEHISSASQKREDLKQLYAEAPRSNRMPLYIGLAIAAAIALFFLVRS
ncbi:MAG: hypothetical protein AAF206_21625, partial [Bacteroidota bacterium]